MAYRHGENPQERKEKGPYHLAFSALEHMAGQACSFRVDTKGRLKRRWGERGWVGLLLSRTPQRTMKSGLMPVVRD